MDKRGNFPTAEELLCSLPEKEIDEVPRKVSVERVSFKSRIPTATEDRIGAGAASGI